MKSRMILLVMVLGLVFSPCAWGQYQYPTVFDVEGEAVDHPDITPVTSTTFTASSVCVEASGGGKKCAKAALISVETGAIRFTLGGTTPTVTSGTAKGHLLNVGDSYVIRGYENVQRAKFIQAVTATGGVLKVTLFF